MLQVTTGLAINLAFVRKAEKTSDPATGQTLTKVTYSDGTTETFRDDNFTLSGKIVTPAPAVV